jgi:hypothetical protein
MRRLAIVLTVAIAALLVPAIATAAPASTAAGDVPIAEAHWGGPPPGCSSIEFSTTIARPETAGGEGTMPSPGEVVPCVLRVHEVEPGTVYTPEVVCLIAVHEDGHLHGLGHSEDPLSIMFHATPLSASEVPECVEPPVEPPPVVEPIATPPAQPWPPGRHRIRPHRRFAHNDPIRGSRLVGRSRLRG